MNTIFINPDSIKEKSITREKLSNNIVSLSGIYPELPSIDSIILDDENKAIGANISWYDEPDKRNSTVNVGDIIIVAQNGGVADINAEINKEYILANQEEEIKWIEFGNKTFNYINENTNNQTLNISTGEYTTTFKSDGLDTHNIKAYSIESQDINCTDLYVNGTMILQDASGNTITLPKRLLDIEKRLKNLSEIVDRLYMPNVDNFPDNDDCNSDDCTFECWCDVADSDDDNIPDEDDPCSNDYNDDGEDDCPEEDQCYSE